MIGRKKREICGYWDCKKRIPTDDFLCVAHHQSWVDGLIDRCPKCGRFKDIMYRLCLDCYIGRPAAQWEPSSPIPTTKQPYKVELSDAWIDGYLKRDRFFVYILEFDDGDFYIGYTVDLCKQLSEHKEQKVPPAAGRNSKLQYVQIVNTQRVAELREAELQKLINSNPDQIYLMISDFQAHMRELGCDTLDLSQSLNSSC